MSVNKKFKILIYPGLHARPGSEFVKLCQSYQSSVIINVDDKKLQIENQQKLLFEIYSQNLFAFH